jgi:hypothetical protein
MAKRLKRIKNKGGRPTKYTRAMANDLCEHLSTGKPLTTWCKQKGNPKYSTVMNWLWRESDYKGEFEKKYARAREQQAECISDQIMDIADDDTGDIVMKEDKRGRKYKAVDHENINRSRLKVDARKWIASKLLPKKFGDSTSVKVGGEEGGAITFLVKYEDKKMPEMGEDLKE